MTSEQMDRLINPPAVMSDDVVALCAPISSVADYMQWIRESEENLRKFFALDDA